MPSGGSQFFRLYGYDLILGFIAAFYVFMVPYTKVEESFNVQAMHDIIHYGHNLQNYDHFQFPGVVPRTFIGALTVSMITYPIVFLMRLLGLPKVYGLFSVRLILGFIVLFTLRVFRIEVRNKFGSQVEGFFVLFNASQFHLMFYCTRSLPNVLSLGLVNLAYGHWIKGNFYVSLKYLVFATAVFRCDMLLFFFPLCIYLLLVGLISFRETLKCCLSTSLICMGFTILVDSVMWQRVLWPELEVFWFNSVMNRSSEWGTKPFHWYFTSALPRSLLAAYPLSLLGIVLDRRMLPYIFPALTFICLYSRLPHKELRFILIVIPIFNVSAAVAANRIYNNRRKKTLWRLCNCVMAVMFLISMGCTLLFFLASYNNYPSGYALKELHQLGSSFCGGRNECRVHIDPFSAMNGISRFCENDDLSWRYSKEEGIPLQDLKNMDFTFLLSEHAEIPGFSCVFIEYGFSRLLLQFGFPPLVLVKEPKVYAHANVVDMNLMNITSLHWPGCPLEH